ncbi:MAG: hypothetical protein Hyperionvirus35_11 [Hyperionvirus sp.]|uniref:Uncharacterized protein n=1 Tax=Hyperionvirus sp. TaxID=2487770 RepID=A0A3G5ABX4_9VIRU|nr:MAG: hypothetical protein Hyperionvirus35_11 [Hyperionvirus sp.]
MSSVVVSEKQVEGGLFGEVTNVFEAESNGFLKVALYHKNNEPVCVDFQTFKERLTGMVGDLFNGLDWSNILLAGGSVLSMLEKNDEKLLAEYLNTDIDLFVYSSVKERLIEKIIYLLSFLKGKLGDCKYFVYKNTYTIDVFSAFGRKIQVIGVLDNDSWELLSNFDLSNCQVGYNGKEIVFTEKFREAMVNRVCETTKPMVQGYRLYKAMLRGFMVKTGACVADLSYYRWSDYSGCAEFNMVGSVGLPKNSLKDLMTVSVGELMESYAARDETFLKKVNDRKTVNNLGELSWGNRVANTFEMIKFLVNTDVTGFKLK